jgi:hypothetical protein
MKNKHRKAGSANGVLDGYAIRAEEYASYLTRRNRPAQVSLERIMNLAEKAQQYVRTKVVNGKTYEIKTPSVVAATESQREKVLARIWAAYEVVLNSEVMHPSKAGKDESWNNAKQDSETKKWVSDPIYFYGDEFENVVGDELYGMKAQGRTPIRSSNYDGDEGGND